MMNLSMNQVLTFWDELVWAYHGCNDYGGHVAEIYLYSMMEHSPSFASSAESFACQDSIEEAKESMMALIRRFEEKYEAVVLEDYGVHDGPGPVTLQGTHRYHLKVVPKEQQGEA